MHDIAVTHHIVLALEPHLALFLGAGLALADDVFLEGDRLGADEKGKMRLEGKDYVVREIGRASCRERVSYHV